MNSSTAPSSWSYPYVDAAPRSEKMPEEVSVLLLILLDDVHNKALASAL